MTEHHYSPLQLFLAEIGIAAFTGQVVHELALLPGWIGGAIGGLAIGVVLRLLDPTLRVGGERIRARFVPDPAPPAPPPAPQQPDPPDDPDLTG